MFCLGLPRDKKGDGEMSVETKKKKVKQQRKERFAYKL